jgi:hypothetical protein
MNHRIVSAVIGLVLLLFAGAALLFGLGMTPHRAAQTSPAAPPVPHETTGPYANCAECHAPGKAAVATPTTHRTFREGSCLTCHRATG